MLVQPNTTPQSNFLISQICTLSVLLTNDTLLLNDFVDEKFETLFGPMKDKTTGRNTSPLNNPKDTTKKKILKNVENTCDLDVLKKIDGCFKASVTQKR